jgi:coenzyme F420-reducing hydrogenase gamma subunit
MVRPTLAVHTLSSCGGCRQALLDPLDALLAVADRVELTHFADLGRWDPEAAVGVAVVEGSVTTPDDEARVQALRGRAERLIAVGACAVAGGPQALRGLAVDGEAWGGDRAPGTPVAERPQVPRPVSACVRVDLELWGCPVDARQLRRVLRDLLAGVEPATDARPVCAQCKARGLECLLVTQGAPCMGPVTRTGCGALCPAYGRACYACFGPAEGLNAESLAALFAARGMTPGQIARKFEFICNGPTAFPKAFASVPGQGGPEMP